MRHITHSITIVLSNMLLHRVQAEDPCAHTELWQVTSLLRVGILTCKRGQSTSFEVIPRIKRDHFKKESRFRTQSLETDVPFTGCWDLGTFGSRNGQW